MKKKVFLFLSMLFAFIATAQVEPIKFNKYGNTVSGYRPGNQARIMLGVFAEAENKPYTTINILRFEPNINEWRIDNVGEDYYTISTHTGLYLTVQGSAVEHAKLIIDHPKRTDAQIWRIVPANDGTYYILSKMNEQLLVTVVGPFVYLEQLKIDSDKFIQEWTIKKE
ncbi:MAG: RICIN domain-containing protein [Bacteroidales bacterium]|nr:RICIN domain-containing protein [Bacteroidales bacterium]